MMDANLVLGTSGVEPTDYYGEFCDKKVLITGAAGVLGGWMADAFARHGAHLVLCDRRVDALADAVSQGRWENVKTLIHQTELRDQASMDSLVAMVEAQWGAPDILINNAGVYPHSPLLDVELDDWKAIIDVNLTAPFYLIKRMAKLMIANGVAGAMVNILSGASVMVSPNGVPYSVSKAALAMLTRGTALEFAGTGIRVNGVSPGFAPGSEVSALDDDYVASMVRSIPLGRTSGPMDSPEAVLFLCSSRASFITGALIAVDGGRTAGPVRR